MDVGRCEGIGSRNLDVVGCEGIGRTETWMWFDVGGCEGIWRAETWMMWLDVGGCEGFGRLVSWCFKPSQPQMITSELQNRNLDVIGFGWL